MITQNNLTAAAQTVVAESHNLQPGSGGRSKAELLAALVLCVYVPAHALGQTYGLQIVPLALGSSSDTNVTLQVGGPNDVLQTELIFQPGGGTGWHIHPGPVVVVIKSGTLAEIHSDGCTSVHPAGSVFFEEANVVHNAVNETGSVTDVYATFLSPSGAQPLIPVPDPGAACPGGVSTISVAIAVNVNTDLNAASPPPATFNIDSLGAIPIAILGSNSYDVTTIDPGSVTFGPKGGQITGAPYFQDVNKDGTPDLILSFVPVASGVGCADTTVVLKGQTYGKQPLTGSEAVLTTHTLLCPR